MLTKIEELMIPIDEYPVFNQYVRIKEAAWSMRRIYCEAEHGKCTECGHRTVLIQDEKGDIVGNLDLWNVLSVLIPESVGGIAKALEDMDVTLAYALVEEIPPNPPKEELENFKTRILKNAQVPCKEIMTPLNKSVQSDDSLLKGLNELYRQEVSILPVYNGEQLVGVIRDSDLFLAAIQIVAE